jgi:hypothetical protein
VDNKKRRERLELQKMQAKVLLQEEKEQHMREHYERQMKIEGEKLLRK